MHSLLYHYDELITTWLALVAHDAHKTDENILTFHITEQSQEKGRDPKSLKARGIRYKVKTL